MPPIFSGGSSLLVRVATFGACLATGPFCACSSSDGAASTSTDEPGRFAADPPQPGGALDTPGGALCSSASFCDDFEAFAPGVTPAGAWTANLANGSVVVDTTRAFRGAQSVKATTLATAASGSTFKSAFIGLAQAPVVPVPGDAFYGRMMFYLESSPTSSVHWNFISASGPVPGQSYSAIYGYGGQLPVDGGSQLMAAYDTPDFYATPSVGPNTDCYQHAAGQVVPVGRWACAEWYFDGPNAELRFWLDGTELSDLAVQGTGQGCVAQDASYRWAGPSFSSIEVGWQSYQEDDERSIWIDDVVISSSPIGCVAPTE